MDSRSRTTFIVSGSQLQGPEEGTDAQRDEMEIQFSNLGTGAIDS